MRVPLLLSAFALVAISRSAASQDGVVAKGTIKAGSGTGRAALVLLASNSGDSFTYQKIEYIRLAGGERVTPQAQSDLRIDGRSSVQSFTGPGLNGGDMLISDIERAASALVRVKGGRGGTTECRTRVPASYKAGPKKLEISLGDTKRFFDAQGNADRVLCTNENVTG